MVDNPTFVSLSLVSEKAIPPSLLALDFDGVICDGLLEYFQTTCRACDRLWENVSLQQLSPFAESFYQLRPVIETGWEMPILLRALMLGRSETEILETWSQVRDRIVSEERLESKKLALTIDTVRDEWIQNNLEEWLGLHRFYAPVIEKIGEISIAETPKIVIITTKEGRFVKQLLQQQGLNIPRERIFGKEVKRPKAETLRQLMQNEQLNGKSIWFVEDRLKTLEAIAREPDLEQISLYLADWGYNTETMRNSIRNNSRIQLLSLQQFAGDWTNWRINNPRQSEKIV